MLMYMYVQTLLKRGVARRRMINLQAVICRNWLMVVSGVCVAHEYFQFQLRETRRTRHLVCPRAERSPVDLWDRVCGVKWVRRCVYARSQTPSDRLSLASHKCLHVITMREYSLNPQSRCLAWSLVWTGYVGGHSWACVAA